MRPVVDLPQMFDVQVRINHGRREAGVPEHLLNRAQVGAADKQMGGECVPERVRRDGSLNSCLGGAPLDGNLGTPRGQPLAVAEVEKYRPVGPATWSECPPTLERVERHLADRHHAEFVALAVVDGHHVAFPVDIAPVQCDGFADAQPGRIEGLNEGTVTPTGQVIFLGSFQMSLSRAYYLVI
jgi:hypothetical protein